jgi:hypothetical protein
LTGLSALLIFGWNMDAVELPILGTPDLSWNVVSEQAPPSGRVILYRTAFYQMMGYLNRFGQWVGSDGQEEAFPVQWWREVG